MPEYTLNGEENKVSQQNLSPDSHPWPNPHCAHFTELAKKNVTTRSSPWGQEGSENCVPVSSSKLTLIVPAHHPSPAHSALGAQKNENGKHIPRVAPADSASGDSQSSWWFGHEDAQAPVRSSASWGPEEGWVAGLYCVSHQAAGEIVTPFIPPLP